MIQLNCDEMLQSYIEFCYIYLDIWTVAVGEFRRVVWVKVIYTFYRERGNIFQGHVFEISMR